MTLRDDFINDLWETEDELKDYLEDIEKLESEMK